MNKTLFKHESNQEKKTYKYKGPIMAAVVYSFLKNFTINIFLIYRSKV